MAKKDRAKHTTKSTSADKESSEDTSRADVAEVVEEPRETPDTAESAESAAVLEAPARELPSKPTPSQMYARLAEKNDAILKLSKANDALEREIGELQDKWARTAADFENYRKRSRKEWDLLKMQTKAEVILETLSVVDDFERAFSVVEESDSTEFVQGIRLIYNNLVQVLERLGVQEIESRLKPFDPNLHMAVGHIERDDVESGMVAEVVQKGYRLDDMVVRPARVIVAK